MSKYDRQNRYNQPNTQRYRRRGLAVILVFISLMVLVSDRQQKAMLASGRLSVDDLSSKIMGGIAYPIRGIELLFSGWKERSEILETSQSLKEEIARLRPFEHQVLDLELRIRRFEEILGVDASSDVAKQKIVTRIVSETNGPFAHSALINIGRNKGVKNGHAVMTIDGLYGHVVRVGEISARVLLLNDLNSGVSVMSQRSLSRAILVGDNTARPELEYISPDSDWRAGDRVVTSGDGGVLPSGLEIGEVIAGVDNTLIVQLFTQNQPIDWVWVLPFTPIPKPQNTPDNPASLESSKQIPAKNEAGAAQ